MTTEGREEVEAAVYKRRTTTRDERILTRDESGQDTSNRIRTIDIVEPSKALSSKALPLSPCSRPLSWHFLVPFPSTSTFEWPP